MDRGHVQLGRTLRWCLLALKRAGASARGGGAQGRGRGADFGSRLRRRWMELRKLTSPGGSSALCVDNGAGITGLAGPARHPRGQKPGMAGGARHVRAFRDGAFARCDLPPRSAGRSRRLAPARRAAREDAISGQRVSDRHGDLRANHAEAWRGRVQGRLRQNRECRSSLSRQDDRFWRSRSRRPPGHVPPPGTTVCQVRLPRPAPVGRRAVSRH